MRQVSQTPPFWLIAKVVEGMIVDDHDLDPAEVAVRVEPRWTALKAEVPVACGTVSKKSKKSNGKGSKACDSITQAEARQGPGSYQCLV